MTTSTGKQISTTVLTGLAVALAVIHNAGVRLGHFGTTDFIALGEQIAENALQALNPQTETPSSN